MPAFEKDELLLAACLRKEAGAWEEFIRRFSKLIYWSIHQTLQESRLRSRQDLAGDIFQDVFQKLFEKKDVLRLDYAGNIKKFLVVLSANLALDRIKSISRFEEKNVFIDAGLAEQQERGKPAGALESPVAGNPDEAASLNERREIVAEVLESLGVKERTCLEMDVFEGRKHREISAVLGISQDNVSSIIRRAKDKIREKFEKKGI